MGKRRARSDNMSFRGSFVTEYIYDSDDYEITKRAFERDGYLIAPPIKVGDEVIPIIAGYLRDTSINCEWLSVRDTLYGLKTKCSLRVVVIGECNIVGIVKKPNGSLENYDFDGAMV